MWTRERKSRYKSHHRLLLLEELSKTLFFFLARWLRQVKHIKHDGNVTLDQVIDIARAMRERSMARTLAGTVKEMLGTCNSVGCTVNGQSPRDIQVGFTFFIADTYFLSLRLLASRRFTVRSPLWFHVGVECAILYGGFLSLFLHCRQILRLLVFQTCCTLWGKYSLSLSAPSGPTCLCFFLLVSPLLILHHLDVYIAPGQCWDRPGDGSTLT